MCLAYLVYVSDMASKAFYIDSVPIFYEFLEVFLMNLPGPYIA